MERVLYLPGLQRGRPMSDERLSSDKLAELADGLRLCGGWLRIYGDMALAELRTLRTQLKERDAELRHWFGCPACHERHDPGVTCPPFEMRTTGQAWFYEKLREAKKREDTLRARVAKLSAELETRTAWRLTQACRELQGRVAELEAAGPAVRELMDEVRAAALEFIGLGLHRQANVLRLRTADSLLAVYAAKTLTKENVNG